VSGPAVNRHQQEQREQGQQEDEFAPRQCRESDQHTNEDRRTNALRLEESQGHQQRQRNGQHADALRHHQPVVDPQVGVHSCESRSEQSCAVAG